MYKYEYTHFVMKPGLLLIGLGNPGASYVHTRHNVGFLALDYLSKEFGEGESGKFVNGVLNAIAHE